MNERKIFRVLIVDDEELARTRIRQLVEKDPELKISGECSSGTQALTALSRERSDIVLLDIQMPGMDGFTLLRKLDPNLTPLVIFVTAYDEFAVKAFELNACDYLLKPFKRKRFEEAIQRAKSELADFDQKSWLQRTCALLENMSGRTRYLDRFPIKERGRVFFIKTTDVDWIEAQDNYVRIHSAKNAYLLRKQIGHVASELDPACFVRIHRGAIVNVDRIQELQQWFKRDYRVVLRNGTILPLGRSYRKALRDVLGSEF